MYLSKYKFIKVENFKSVARVENCKLSIDIRFVEQTDSIYTINAYYIFVSLSESLLHVSSKLQQY